MTALDVGRGASARWLRAVAALASAGILADLFAQRASPIVLGIAVLLAVAGFALPASPAPLILIGVAALVVTVSGDDPVRPGVLVLLPLVHLLHLSCALAALVPKGARLAPRALVPTLRRAALTQLAVFATALTAALVPAGRTPAAIEVAALLAVAALAGLLVFLDRSR